MDSIGTILKSERDSRGLSLEEVHDATRITVQNLTALEEDRFDYFPNRVYARAFLRDYANFLGLDSGGMLERYEQEWNVAPEVVAPAPKSGRSVWRVAGWLLFVLVLAGALGAAGYFGWRYYERQHAGAARLTSSDDKSAEKGAVLPSSEPIHRLKPQAKPKPPVVVPKPVQPTAPAGHTIEVTAVQDSWVEVYEGKNKSGKQLMFKTLPAGQKATFSSKVGFYVFSGNSQVHIKFDGKDQPPLGPYGKKGDGVFVPKPPAVSAPVP